MTCVCVCVCVRRCVCVCVLWYEEAKEEDEDGQEEEEVELILATGLQRDSNRANIMWDYVVPARWRCLHSPAFVFLASLGGYLS